MRRRRPDRREINPDPKFGDLVVAKFINNLMKDGKTKEMIDLLPDFTEQTVAETEAGCLTWLMSALGFPDYKATVHAYGTVIGTGNAIIGWDPKMAKI